MHKRILTPKSNTDHSISSSKHTSTLRFRSEIHISDMSTSNPEPTWPRESYPQCFMGTPSSLSSSLDTVWLSRNTIFSLAYIDSFQPWVFGRSRLLGIRRELRRSSEKMEKRTLPVKLATTMLLTVVGSWFYISIWSQVRSSLLSQQWWSWEHHLHLKRLLSKVLMKLWTMSSL